MKKIHSLRYILLSSAAAVLCVMPCCPHTAYSDNITALPGQSGTYSLPWYVVPDYNTNTTLSADSGKLIITIKKNANNQPAQIVCRGLNIKEGCTYKVSFTVDSTNEGYFDTWIGSASSQPLWINQQDAGEGSSERIHAEADTEFTVEETFTADSSIPSAEWIFQLGGTEQNSGELLFPDGTVITISNLSLENIDDPSEKYTAPTTEKRSEFLTNQLGFLADAPKNATLLSSSLNPIHFTVTKADDKKNIVMDGNTTVYGDDKDSGDSVHKVDLSSINEKGSYIIRFDGINDDFPFRVTDNKKYVNILKDAVAFFDICNSKISAKDSYICFDEGYGTCYTSNIELSVWTLQNQYEFSKRYGMDSSLFDGISASTGEKIPDILDVSRQELEWMMSMTSTEMNSKGFTYSYAASDNTAPPWEGGNYAEYVFKPKNPTISDTFAFAACSAQASRIWKEYDSSFAAECLKSAKAAYSVALKKYQAEPDTESSKNAADELYWAASELAAADNTKKYLDDISDISVSFKQTDTSWRGLLSAIAYSSDSSVFDTTILKSALINNADTLLKSQLVQGYGLCPMPGRGERKYSHGSNGDILRNSMILSYAFELSGDTKYSTAAVSGLDYILGRNPMGISYITGYGEKAVQNPYHLLWANQIDSKYDKAPSGILVSGPEASPSDTWLNAAGIGNSVNVLKRYADNFDARSVNSSSVMNNAALSWMAGFIADADLDSPATEKNNSETTSTTTSAATETTTSTDPVSESSTTENITSETSSVTTATAHEANNNDDENITKFAIICGASVIGLCTLELLVYKIIKKLRKK